MEARTDASNEKFEALRGTLVSRMDIHQARTEANPEKMKASLEEMKATVDVFEERLDKMDTTDLEANQEKLNAVVKHQEVPKRPPWELSEHWRVNMGNSS
jgi:hypothetical protein